MWESREGIASDGRPSGGNCRLDWRKSGVPKSPTVVSLLSSDLARRQGSEPADGLGASIASLIVKSRRSPDDKLHLIYSDSGRSLLVGSLLPSFSPFARPTIRSSGDFKRQQQESAVPVDRSNGRDASTDRRRSNEKVNRALLGDGVLALVELPSSVSEGLRSSNCVQLNISTRRNSVL